jgi:hypothetical protein
VVSTLGRKFLKVEKSGEAAAAILLALERDLIH